MHRFYLLEIQARLVPHSYVFQAVFFTGDGPAA